MRVNPSIPLAFNAGYVDTFGFLALQGLFTAHVTGNFVTIGAALAHGSTGVLTKLLALPVFCAVVILSRLSGRAMARRGWADLAVLCWSEILLLGLAAGLGVAFGPFADADAPAAMATGLVIVAAMAIQNAAHRIHMPSEAPSTLMTGTTTQILLDVADLLREAPPEGRAALVARLKRLSKSVVAFAAGCAAAALGFVALGRFGFVAPPLFAFAAWRAVEAGRRAAAAGTPTA